MVAAFGLPRDEAISRSHEVLYYVGLGEARYRNVETYSTGMKQRLGLAAALLHDPDLLILDLRMPKKSGFDVGFFNIPAETFPDVP